MTRSAWRKRVKVIGLVLSLMMLALWVFSVMLMSYYVPPSSQWFVGIAYGRISFGDSTFSIPGWACFPVYSDWKLAAAELPWTGFAHDWLGFGLPGKPEVFPGILDIPIWLFVVAVGFPTAILWWRDRRPVAGSCMVCKYDLAGNISGTCPECGTGIE